METGSEHAAQIPLYIVMIVAACASIALNIGKAVQKMKVQVLKKGRLVLTPPYRKDFLVWVVGISLTLVAGILTMVAQNMTDKSSIVASLNGIGLVGLALFSLFVLKERVGPREWFSIAMIIVGTAVVSYFNKASHDKHYNLTAMLWCSGIAIAFLAAMTAASTKMGRGQAFVYAMTAGVGLGLMNIVYHIGPIVAPGGFTAQFSTPYPWIGFLFLGNIGFLMTNLAFFHGAGITVVPTVNSFLIISPMVIEVFVFGTRLNAPQYAGAGIIVAGIILLTTGQGAEGAIAANEPVKAKCA